MKTQVEVSRPWDTQTMSISGPFDFLDQKDQEISSQTGLYFGCYVSDFTETETETESTLGPMISKMISKDKAESKNSKIYRPQRGSMRGVGTNQKVRFGTERKREQQYFNLTSTSS